MNRLFFPVCYDILLEKQKLNWDTISRLPRQNANYEKMSATHFIMLMEEASVDSGESSGTARDHQDLTQGSTLVCSKETFTCWYKDVLKDATTMLLLAVKKRHYWKIHCNSFFFCCCCFIFIGSYYVALGDLDLIAIHLSQPPKHWHTLLCPDFSFILFERLH